MPQRTLDKQARVSVQGEREGDGGIGTGGKEGNYYCKGVSEEWEGWVMMRVGGNECLVMGSGNGEAFGGL